MVCQLMVGVILAVGMLVETNVNSCGISMLGISLVGLHGI